MTTVYETATQLIIKHLDMADVHAEDWNKLKWGIITKTMNEMNSPGNCVISEFTMSTYYDRVFYEKFM